MATFTDNWDSDRPSDDTNATEIDDYMNKLATDIEERLKQWVYGYVAGENDGIGGLIYAKFKEQTSTPTTPASVFGLVAKDDTGTSLYALPESGGTAVKLLNASGQICAGAYAADSIDQDDIRLANNNNLTWRNAAGDGDINCIKVNASDVPEILVGAVLSADTAPASDAAISNKKYADTKEALIATQATAGLFGAWTSNDTTPAALALNTVYKAECDGFVVVIDTDSDNGILGYTDSNNPPTTVRGVGVAAGSGSHTQLMMPVKKDDYVKITCTTAISTIYWIPFGTGGLADQT